MDDQTSFEPAATAGRHVVEALGALQAWLLAEDAYGRGGLNELGVSASMTRRLRAWNEMFGRYGSRDEDWASGGWADEGVAPAHELQRELPDVEVATSTLTTIDHCEKCEAPSRARRHRRLAPRPAPARWTPCRDCPDTSWPGARLPGLLGRGPRGPRRGEDRRGRPLRYPRSIFRC
ncbi:hypothetical protein Apa02nite_094290 [Actinoplanes palleronii]|uniref:Uncharacterized protein n=1 Tax=Actinoplanes palleronii TaxID=113570 RepID=A0ABQ4BRM4_9ACTN|nr:hypothetical protein Apa02nite_094290 [Actinoplanes palleronii]